MRSEVREFVLLRDGGCVARFVGSKLDLMRFPMLAGLPDPGQCRNEFGGLLPKTTLLGFNIQELDHVEDFDQPDYGRKPPSDVDHLWVVCPFHHRGKTNSYAWATLSVVREAAPAYIAAANRAAIQRGLVPPPPEHEEIAGPNGI